MGENLRHGQPVFPVGLYGRLGDGGLGAAGPIGSGKELGFQALTKAKGGAGNGHAYAGSKSGALRIEDWRTLELLQHSVKGRYRAHGSAYVVAEDGNQQVGGGSDDGDVARRGLQRQSARVLEQNHAF